MIYVSVKYLNIIYTLKLIKMSSKMEKIKLSRMYDH